MKTAIAFGTFDGLHAGHREVLAATEGYKRIAVTFSVPPKFTGSGGGQIMTLAERKKGLKELGIDEIECLQFEYFKDMQPLEFLEFIKSHFEVSLMSCGFNFRFGKGASGTTETLKRFCEENGIELVCIPPVKVNGKTVSSSLIRTFIEKGDIKSANEYLFHPYSFTAEVIKGDQRGRTMGFPTANQPFPTELLPPKTGVYESKVSIFGKIYKGITNIGYRPTFKTEQITSETHIIGFNGDLYGKEITVYLKRYLRNEQKFKTLQELKKAIKNDYTEVTK